MRYAIVSDLHANLAAWQSVLTDIADLKADKIICLGDVVGYGPNPVEVLESVYRVVNVTLMGNHDAAVCGRLSTSTFTPRAVKAVERHRQVLTTEALQWISQLPLTWDGSGFRCTHGDFSNPGSFRYIVAPESALPSWQATPEQLLFVGHSHYPGIYVIGSSGTPHFVAPCDFELEEGKRYIINPGSVGYPRIGDIRTSYCIYDDATHAITFRQLPFDSAGYRKAMNGAGFEDDPWIQQKAEQKLPTLREVPLFGKATEQTIVNTDATDTATPQTQPSAVKHTLKTPWIAAGVVALLAVGALTIFQLGRSTVDSRPLAITVPDFELPSWTAYPLEPYNKNLLPPLPPALNPDGRLANWRYAFENQREQEFHSGLRDSVTTLCIHNAKKLKVQLESPLINLAGTQLSAVRLKARIRKPASFSGNVIYQIITYATDHNGNQTQTSLLPFPMHTSKGKLSPPGADRNVSIKLNSRTTHLRLRIEGDFLGQLEIEQPMLTANQKESDK